MPINQIINSDMSLKITQTKLNTCEFSLFSQYLNNCQKVNDNPIYLVIEPTNYCNLNCVMCPRNNMTRPLGIMDITLFKKIIDEVEGKVEFIYLHFFGEPLLNKQIYEFIQYASGKGITIGMSTNGTLLNDENSKLLIKSNLDLLIISVDSLNRDTYNKIRPGGDLPLLLNQIEQFLDIHQSLNSQISVSIQMIEMNENRMEISEFKTKWNSAPGVNVVIKPLYNYANQVEGISELGYPVTQNDCYRKVCVEPWRGFVICWDGVVVPCCNDFNQKNPIGNVTTNSIQEIWNSDAMREMRSCQVEGKQKNNKLCNGCIIHHEDYLHGISHISCFNPSRKESYVYFDKGLYPVEIAPECETLWTMKNFEISVQDRFQDIILFLCNNHPEYKEIRVKIELFNKYVKDEIIGRKSKIILKTPDQFKGQLLRYSFYLEDDWRPCDYGINDDTRKLGIIIDKIVNG